MNTLHIVCTPKAAEFLPGEQLLVTSELKNDGSQPAMVIDLASGATSPFTYELRSAKDSQIVYSVSASERRTRVAGGDVVPREEPALVELKPGTSTTITEDLAEYAPAGFVTGRYQIIARYAAEGIELASSPAEMRIEAPRNAALASIFCPTKRVFCSAFDHAGFDKTTSLFHRETFTHDPENGSFRRWITLKEGPTAAPVQGMAIALQSDFEAKGRWFAWLQKNAIAGAKVWRTALMLQIAPGAIELQEPRLLDAGFQLQNGSAIFAIIGRKDNRLWLQLVVLQDKAARLLPPAPVCESIPEQILPHFVATDGGGRLILIWAESTSGVTRLYSRGYDLNGRSEETKPNLLYERKSAMVDFNISPIGFKAPGELSALFGPEKSKTEDQKEPVVIFCRLPLTENSKPLEDKEIIAPKEAVLGWNISAPVSSGTPILATMKDSLAVAVAGQDGWQMLIAKPGNISRLHMLVDDLDGVWAGWMDPMIGLHFQRLTSGRRTSME